MTELVESAGADSLPCYPRRVYRGESSGEMFTQFDLRKTNAGVGFFFAEDIRQAQGYARNESHVRSFTLRAARCLDLTDPYVPAVRDFVRAFSAEFDEWVDRRSGETTDVGTLLESGMLYDYEGTGSGTRWNALFALAMDMGYDCVRVLDSTDGVAFGPVVVVFDPQQIEFISDVPMVDAEPRPRFRP